MHKKNGDWTIKSSRQIFKNDFFLVCEDEVIEPDGKDGKFAIIEFKEGSALLAVDQEKNIYLTEQFRYALGRTDLEAAAGGIEGETPLAAARREAREELGIEAEKWTHLGRVEGNTSITKTVTDLFLAQKLTFTRPQPEESEKIRLIRMSLADAVEKVMNGEITHDLTCLLILKTKLLLEKTGDPSDP